MKRIKSLGIFLLLCILFSSCNTGTDDSYADGSSGATKKSLSNKIASGNSDWWPNQLNLSILRQNSVSYTHLTLPTTD